MRSIDASNKRSGTRRAAASAALVLASLGSASAAQPPPAPAAQVAPAGVDGIAVADVLPTPATTAPSSSAATTSTPSGTTAMTHQDPCPGPDGRIKWLRPPHGVNPINTDHTVTAKVVDHTDGGEDCEFVEVLFEVSQHGNPSPTRGIAVTGSKGNASFTFTNSQPSINVVLACTTIWGTAPTTCDPTDPDQHVAIARKEWIAPGYFTCRASVFRIEGSVAQPDILPEPFEPEVANQHGSTCQSDTAGLLPPTTILGGNGSITVMGAETATSDPHVSAHSEAGVLHLFMTDGTNTLEVSVLTAEADGECVAGVPTLTGSSRVVEVLVNGSGIAVPPGNSHEEVPLGPFGTIHLNESTTEPTVDGMQHTQRAFWLEGNPVLGDVIVAEAIADQHGTPCAPTI